MQERSRRHPALVRSALVALALSAVLAPPVARAADASHGHHGADVMSEESMRRWVDDWFATHPRVGVSAAKRTADAVVNASGFRFDADGNAGTAVDTVKINTGESVQWVRLDGSHTVTNGTGFADPNAGTLFDAPLNAVDDEFIFTFEQPGTYPFFCRPHEAFTMKGVVVVSSPTGVTPLPGTVSRVGFTRDPAPNPTAHGVEFEFALRSSGTVRIEVFDARGARVATVADRAFPPGAWRGRWDGTRSDGGAAGAGVYWLRLAGPELSQSRRVVITP
jgi:plastocyanin